MAQMGLGLGVNLAIGGIQQMMAPDPSTDNQQDESYIFQGSKQNIVEGDPVPVLYGELRIPGRTISFHTRRKILHSTIITQEQLLQKAIIRAPPMQQPIINKFQVK